MFVSDTCYSKIKGIGGPLYFYKLILFYRAISELSDFLTALKIRSNY